MQSIRRDPEHRHCQLLIRSSANERRCAFTIIELVIVVLIMSIFAAVTAPAFLDSLLFHRVETAARRVKGDIDYARQRARLTSAAQPITFSNSTYTLGGTAKSLDHPNAAYTVDLQQSPYLLDSATANFGGAQTFSFDGYGSPSSGGAIVLRAKTHECTVTVDSVTGTATITSNHTNGGTAQVTGG